jgi:hypothetical protein
MADGVPLPPSDENEDTEDKELRFECPLRGIPGRLMDLPGLAIKVSALSNTLPWNAAAKESLRGVLGTVACIAGPRAALCGVMET